ncbi:Cytochrome c553 [Modicisalibacter ilicicola DSM 19980]|uniref:Cytochrome c553 n=1 Tax=Modicisalibacter ilicicola DSM 19980 TaxID=1121942 RepID=A0A1M5AWU4_9GAMM|nr:c-type cytochrome [Halomonas ilicicola]SHF34695.1 Cytochrome c553 [Halomonas ilicicola DSM 19980]
MRSFMTRGRFALLTTVIMAGAGLVLSPGQAQEKASGARSDAKSLEKPLAAVYYGQAAAQADTQSVEGLIGQGSGDTWACASCHGDRGQGAENVPRLAGLPAGYITKQLHDYANRRRLNDNMQYVVEGLTDDQMAALGRYYAEMESPSSARPGLSGDLDRGRELALQGDWSLDVPACYSCHGSSGWGVGQAFPALAGQHPSYTYNQLASWKSGRRANSPINLMHNVAMALSEHDMRSVADYLASLPAAPGGRQAGLDTPAPGQLPPVERAASSQQGSADHE